MRKPLGKLALACSLISVSAFSCFAQVPKRNTATDGVQSHILGTWRGNSVCTENSPCHDELNVYRFSEIAGKPRWFSVTASKLVNGKEIVMGTGEWKYDVEKHVLESENAGGTFRLTVDGDNMEGSLTLRDNTVYRRIHLKKEK